MKKNLAFFPLASALIVFFAQAALAADPIEPEESRELSPKRKTIKQGSFLYNKGKASKQDGLITPPGSLASQERRNAKYLWNFGLLDEGNVAMHNFIFKNESGKPLKITGVNTTCGCTGSKIDKAELAPGEATVLSVQFNSKGYKNGPVTQRVYVNTDDPDKPVVQYTIKAEITNSKK